MENGHHHQLPDAAAEAHAPQAVPQQQAQQPANPGDIDPNGLVRRLAGVALEPAGVGEPSGGTIVALVHTLLRADADAPTSPTVRRTAHDLAELLSVSTANCTTAVGAGAIRALVPLLESRDAGLQQHAACALGHLARNDAPHRASLASAGAIPPLVRLLDSTDTAVQRAAANALCNLACCRVIKKAGATNAGAVPPLVRRLDLAIGAANQVSIASARAIRPLVRLLGSADGTVQRAAAAALSNLAFENAANQASIADASAILLLVPLLDSATAQLAAADALGNLASSNDPNKASIASAGAIEPLVDLLGSPDVDMQRCAALALSNLAHVSPANSASIAGAGAIPPLVQLLGSPDTEVQTNAALALSNLAHDRNANAHIASAGAVPPLVQLLGREEAAVQHAAAAVLCNLAVHASNKASIATPNTIARLVQLLSSSDTEVLRGVAGVLGNLAYDNAAAAASIANAQAIPPLVNLLRSGSADARRAAVVVLRNLARSNATHQARIANAGAIPLLVRLLDSADPEAQVHAADILIFLGKLSPANRASMVSLGAIPLLVRLLTGGDADARFTAAAALTNLAADVANRVSIAQAGAIPPLVRLLDSTEGTTLHTAAIALKNLALDSPANTASITRANAVPKLVGLLGRADVLAQEGLADALSRCLVQLLRAEEAPNAVPSGAVPNGAGPSGLSASSSRQPREPTPATTQPQLLAELNTWPDKLDFQQVCRLAQTALNCMQAQAEHNCRWIWRDELEEERWLGGGAFGVVCQYHWAGHGPVAVKWVQEKDEWKRPIQGCAARTALKEVYHLAKLGHPNIVKLHGVTADEARSSLGIVMEYVEGTVVAVVAQKPAFTAEHRFQVAMEVADALCFLHTLTPPIVHHDLSGSNILVTTDNHAKLIDFGVSQEWRQTYLSLNRYRGTAAWAAPEVLFDTKDIQGTAVRSTISGTCDVHSFGVLLGLLATREEPWAGFADHHIVARLQEGMRLAAPVNIQLDLAALIAECLSPEPAARPSFQTARQRLAGMGPNAFALTGTWPTL